MAQHDGVACARRVGRELGRLKALGFAEITRNGKGAIAKLTIDGYRALVFRLRPHVERWRGSSLVRVES
jgi:hypothetical protein